MKGVCPKCKREKVLTKHHVYPVRHFGRNSKKLVWLCRKCHDLLETKIPFDQQPNEFYRRVVREFLRDS